MANTPWTIRLRPTEQVVAAQQSYLPVGVVLLSLFMATLVTLVVHYAQRVHQRSRSAEEAIAALRRSEQRYEIAVRGSFQGGTGTIKIDGTMISLNADLTTDNIQGNIDLDYSSCAVSTALNNLSVTAPSTYRGFMQF